MNSKLLYVRFKARAKRLARQMQRERKECRPDFAEATRILWCRYQLAIDDLAIRITEDKAL